MSNIKKLECNLAKPACARHMMADKINEIIGVVNTGVPGTLPPVQDDTNTNKAYIQPDWGQPTELVSILEETSFEVDTSMGMAVFNESFPYALVGGWTYEVIYNGNTYNCVCVEHDDGTGNITYMLGDVSMAGISEYPSTGEPFVVAYYCDTLAEEYGFKWGVVPFDGATTVTLAINGMSGEILPIPAKYVEPPLIVTNTNSGKVGILDVDYLSASIEEIEQAILSGRNVYLGHGSNLSPLMGANEDRGPNEPRFVFGHFEKSTTPDLDFYLILYYVIRPQGTNDTVCYSRQYTVSATNT